MIDLAGLPSVTSLEALVGGTPAHFLAKLSLTEAANVAVRGLQQAGYDAVRVFDAHDNGAGTPNLLAFQLRAGTELDGSTGAFTARLFDEVDAVACLGMHAPAGALGFAAHTVNLAARWRLGGQLVSEADLLLDLAASRGLPSLFVVGKPGASATAATEPSLEGLGELARTAAPRPAPALPRGPLALDFHTRACADAAERTGARRVGPRTVEVEGATQRERYERAVLAAEAGWGVLALAVASAPPAWKVQDLTALFQVPWEPVDPGRPASTRALLAAVRADTADGAEKSSALWALTLHMLEGLTPRFFVASRLEPMLKEGLDALDVVSSTLDPSLDPDLLQARFDAVYLKSLHDRPGPIPGRAAVQTVLDALRTQQSELYAWLLCELAKRFGVDVRVPFDDRWFRGAWRTHDLYQLTHLVLLNTDYFQRPAAHPDLQAWAASLVAAVPIVLAQEATDLAGELVISLVALGEGTAPVVSHLLALMARFSGPDGRLTDPTGDRPVHATAVALLAWAAAEEHGTPTAVSGSALDVTGR